MSENSYHVDDIVRLSARFELSNTLTDPVTVTLKITPPSSVASWLSPVIKDSVGLYHYDYTPPVPGTYKYRFYGAGTVEANAALSFKVEYEGS